MAAPNIPEGVIHTPRDNRVTTILLVGRVSSGTRDNLCRIRNISVGGMRIETLAPLDVGQQIDIELKNGVTVHAEVRWARDAAVGVRFDAPVDIDQILAPAEPSQCAIATQVTRSPRLAAHSPIAFRHAGRIQSAVLADVSQGGAKLRVGCAAKVGDPVVLFIPGLESRRATIRWVGDDVVGVSFAEKIGFADLSKWLAGPLRFAPQAADPLNQVRQNS